MKTLSFLKKPVYVALVFFGTLIVLSVGYSLVGNLSLTDKVVSGSGLTASSWNKIIDGVLDLDTRLLDTSSKVSNFSFSGGNVGIGTTDPKAKLHVAGNAQIDGRINSTGGNAGMSFAPCTSDEVSTFVTTDAGWGNFLVRAGGSHVLVSDPDITIVNNRIKVTNAGKYMIAGNVFCDSGGDVNDYTHVGVQQVDTAGALVGPLRLFSHGSPTPNNDTYSEKSGTTMFNLAAGGGLEIRSHNHNNPTCYCSQYYNSWVVWKL